MNEAANGQPDKPVVRHRSFFREVVALKPTVRSDQPNFWQWWLAYLGAAGMVFLCNPYLIVIALSQAELPPQSATAWLTILDIISGLLKGLGIVVFGSILGFFMYLKFFFMISIPVFGLIYAVSYSKIPSTRLLYILIGSFASVVPILLITKEITITGVMGSLALMVFCIPLGLVIWGLVWLAPRATPVSKEPKEPTSG
ncbi:hypothetical protein ACTL6U_16055 [Rhodovibrionaceae bacterium A322]